MTRQEFIQRYVIHNPGALSVRIEQAQEAWDAVSKIAPTPRTEKAREAKDKLTDDEQKGIAFVFDRWTKTNGVPKERSKKGDVARAVIKHRPMNFKEVQKGAINYLNYMVDQGRAAYVPGLQVWLNRKEWLEWQGEEQKEREDNAERQKLMQNLSHAKHMLELDPDNEGWQNEVKQLTEKMRV